MWKYRGIFKSIFPCSFGSMCLKNVIPTPKGSGKNFFPMNFEISLRSLFIQCRSLLSKLSALCRLLLDKKPSKLFQLKIHNFDRWHFRTITEDYPCQFSKFCHANPRWRYISNMKNIMFLGKAKWSFILWVYQKGINKMNPK